VREAVISLRAAAASEFDAVVALLDSAGLPIRDLRPQSLENFLVAVDARAVVGAAALERYGDVGLLRSVVVAAEHRGAGLGVALVEAIERRARDHGVGFVVLLTETAKKFFAAKGFITAQRADAPAAVQASSEFALVCPASATYMVKVLR
jgi:amino-acid N-acetyltransferase